MDKRLLFLFFLGSGGVLGQSSPQQKILAAQAEYRTAVARCDTPAMAEAAYLLGKRYRSVGEGAASWRWMLLSLRLRESRGPSQELNKVYIQLGSSSETIKDYAQAYVYGHKALANSRKLNHPHSLMSSYTFLSGLHWIANRAFRFTTERPFAYSADSALFYIQRAEAVARQIKSPLEIAYVLRSKGGILAEKAPRQAIDCFNGALKVHEARNDLAQMISLNLELVQAYIYLNDLDRARTHLLAVEQMSRVRPVDYMEGQVLLHQTLARYYRATQNWKEAHREAMVVDSLEKITESLEHRAAIAQLSIVYDTEKQAALLKARDAELALQHNTLQTQRYINRGMFGLLLLSVGVGFAFYRLNRQNRQISLQNAHLVREQSHRMKNHLHTVSALLSLQSNRLTDDSARRAVEESQLRVHTIALLNQQLHQGEELVTLGLPQFIPKLVRTILDSYGFGQIEPLYQLQNVPIHIDQAIPLALIINELVTNACKYAFNAHPDPQLTVRCWEVNGKLHLQVRDNGPGWLTSPENKTGFGQRLIDLQVRQLRGEHTFSGPPGVTFDLVIGIK
ncbi:sensor histidine kinase [Rudanella lutea]|uniref:sensor histidine kinase n=1 Tax=Rudanella lutea TaxID=451374 RepID=UPI000A0397B3|nr:sensor histidine kinase [Rudanella lutea]